MSHWMALCILRLRVGFVVALMSALVATGCGSSGPVMGRVSGEITYKGQADRKKGDDYIHLDRW